MRLGGTNLGTFLSDMMGSFAGQVPGKALCLFYQVLTNPVVGGVEESNEANPNRISDVDRAAKFRLVRRDTGNLHLPTDL